MTHETRHDAALQRMRHRDNRKTRETASDETSQKRKIRRSSRCDTVAVRLRRVPRVLYAEGAGMGLRGRIPCCKDNDFGCIGTCDIGDKRAPGRHPVRGFFLEQVRAPHSAEGLLCAKMDIRTAALPLCGSRFNRIRSSTMPHHAPINRQRPAQASRQATSATLAPISHPQNTTHRT